MTDHSWDVIPYRCRIRGYSLRLDNLSEIIARHKGERVGCYVALLFCRLDKIFIFESFILRCILLRGARYWPKTFGHFVRARLNLSFILFSSFKINEFLRVRIIKEEKEDMNNKKILSIKIANKRIYLTIILTVKCNVPLFYFDVYLSKSVSITSH
jgi:hypothetical protein